MNQKFDVIELESHLRPFQKEAERIQRTIQKHQRAGDPSGLMGYRNEMDNLDNAERLLEERRANGACPECGKGLRGGKCEDCN